MKTIIVEKHNRKFICNIDSEFSGAMCCVEIWEEVRPNWKFFKDKYCCSKSFWIADFNTILEGIVAMVGHYLEDEGCDKEVAKKWQEFRDC